MSIAAELEKKAINTIRTLSIDAIQKANSGHPGAPMGLAPVAFTLWESEMQMNPANPHWPNRDRFVLSAGHASMLLYSLLHLFGYDLGLEDIKNFRQLHSICAGHPEFGLAPGVETTTGPLGQGAATSVGMAMAAGWKADRYNKPEFTLFDYSVYAIAGDGCMMEGVSAEAASLAGHLGLNNLVWIYDSNRITIEGSTGLAFTEDTAKRFESYGWNVKHVEDANDTNAVAAALKEAKADKSGPVLIIVNSHIGYGSPKKQDTASAHGEPLGDDEIRATKHNYGWDENASFYVPAELQDFRKQQLEKGQENEAKWNELFSAYKSKFPELAAELEMMAEGNLPDDWENALPEFEADAKGLASRGANGKILNAIGAKIPWLMGGSADLAPSTKTWFSGENEFSKGQTGKNIHFGVREHAMGAIVNGLTLSGLRAFGATFLVFLDYMKPAVRLAALMKIPSLFIYTHDSIGLGEDGPTHQPIEHFDALRSTPNLELIRPADANELSQLWKHILKVTDHPIALALTRQNIPTLDRSNLAAASDALHGGYILSEAAGDLQAIIIATGSEVSLAIEAQRKLENENIHTRVVSMPSMWLFEQQDKAYREKVLPPNIRARVAIEAGTENAWHKYTGLDGVVIGMQTFGESAPYQQLLTEFGFSADNICEKVKSIL